MKPSLPIALLAAPFFAFGVTAAELSTTVDPAKQAAWEEARSQAAKRVADFEAAVKSGTPERIRKAGLDLQSDPMAVQKLNQANRPDLVDAHNGVTEQIKAGAKGNIKDNMAKEWNRLHPNDPPITRNDVEVYEPTNYKDPSAKPKSGQDWDVTVRVKPKGTGGFVDVPPAQSQQVVEKSYYDAAGGEKTFGKRPPGVTPEQAAASAAHRQAVETTHGKSPEAYNQPETILGSKTEKPRTGERLADPEQLTLAIENKSNQSRNKAAQAAAAGNPTEAVRQEAEQMRQASKQFDKITKPRVEAAGGEVHSQVEKGMSVVRDAGSGSISPEQARAELAKMGETPESIISKASGQAEAAQKLSPKSPKLTKASAPEPAGGKVAIEGPDAPKLKAGSPEPAGGKALKGAGAVLLGIDIAATAEDVKEDLKKGDVMGAATKLGEAGANAITAGGYSTITGTKEKFDDMTDAEKQIALANKRNEVAYDLQAEKKLRQAGVSRGEVAKIMDAKAKGDDSALESKFKELGVQAPERIVEKGPVKDDTVEERALAVAEGLVEYPKKAGKFVKEAAQDVTEMTNGLTEKGVASEVFNQARENISDWQETRRENANAEKTTADFKQGVKDRLIAKGATPEGAQKAADALVNDGDPSMVRRLSDILAKKNGSASKDSAAAPSSTINNKSVKDQGATEKAITYDESLKYLDDLRADVRAYHERLRIRELKEKQASGTGQQPAPVAAVEEAPANSAVSPEALRDAVSSLAAVGVTPPRNGNGSDAPAEQSLHAALAGLKTIPPESQPPAPGPVSEERSDVFAALEQQAQAEASAEVTSQIEAGAEGEVAEERRRQRIAAENRRRQAIAAENARRVALQAQRQAAAWANLLRQSTAQPAAPYRQTPVLQGYRGQERQGNFSMKEYLKAHGRNEQWQREHGFLK